MPIRAEYSGVNYRSRLEARWAVFLTTMGITFEYEPYLLDIPGLEAEDWQTSRHGLPPDAFPLKYRDAVEAARRAMFDGWDKDRETKRKRYA